MWFTILLIYCAVCWIAALAMTRVLAPQFAARAAERGISPIAFQFGSILIGPIALPLILWSTAKMLWARFRRRGQLRYCLKTVREYEFAKVNSLYLAEPIRRLFEQHTPALFQLGFELIGDYRMKSQPVEVHDRIFVSADGETLATISAVLQRGGVSLISILSDGTCVHTSSVKNPKPERTLQPGDQLYITFLPGISVEEQSRRHLDTVREQSAVRGASVVRQQADQFREVLVYDQRIFNRWRFRHGDLPVAPPAPDFGTLSRTEFATANV